MPALVRLVVASLLLAVGEPASGRPHLEWRTLYFSLNGPTFVFQERPDETRTEDCSNQNAGRACWITTWIRKEPCIPGTGRLTLLRRLQKLDVLPSGRGQFLVETLSPPWSKMYPEAIFVDHPIDEYALVRGVRVYGPHCEEADVFYWVHDFRILELNRYDPETGAKLPN